MGDLLSQSSTLLPQIQASWQVSNPGLQLQDERGARMRRPGAGALLQEATSSPPAPPPAAAPGLPPTRGRRAVAAAAAGRSQPVTRAARGAAPRAREGAGLPPGIIMAACSRERGARPSQRRRPAPLRATASAQAPARGGRRSRGAGARQGAGWGGERQGDGPGRRWRGEGLASGAERPPASGQAPSPSPPVSPGRS